MTNLVTVRLSTNTFEALEYSRAFFFDNFRFHTSILAYFFLVLRHSILRKSKWACNLIDGIPAEILGCFETCAI